MTTYPNMGLAVPTQGGDSGTWDDKINACFALIDAHDHTSGKGVQIPVAGLNIDTDLPMGSHGLTGVGRVDFTPIATLAAGANVLFVDLNDGELYYRTTGGTNVKLTLGTSINTTLVGGIVGDYTSVGAEVAYDAANKRYTFKDSSSPTKKWARLASGPVRIYEYNSTDSVYVEHAVDAALASSYTVTWPAALPGATQMVTITDAGVVAFDGVLGANQNITLSGTGKIKHGNYTRLITFDSNDVIDYQNGTVGHTTGDGGSTLSANAPATSAYYRIPTIPANERLVSIVITGTGASSSIGLLYYNTSNATYAPVPGGVTGGSGSGSAYIGNVGGTWTLTPPTPLDGNIIFVIQAVAAASTTMNLRCGVMTTDAA